MNNVLDGMFGAVGEGMCRLSMSGQIAIKTSNGYKTYNVKTGRLTDCSNFVLNVGEGMFFVIPTSKVARGDIILVNGKPKCVISSDKDKITVINYEDSTVEMLVPERHIFMGNTYFYGKIVSMFGNTGDKKNGGKKIMKYMMLSQMFGNKQNTSGIAGNGMSAMLPYMMLGGMSDMDNLFDGMFDLGEDDSEDDADDSDSKKED